MLTLLNLSPIRRQKPDPIAIHFNSTEHSVNDYEIMALEKICGDNSYRDNRKTVDEISENLFGAFGLTTRPSSAELYYVMVHLNLS
jgi:hypothetical protein